MQLNAAGSINAKWNLLYGLLDSSLINDLIFCLCALPVLSSLSFLALVPHSSPTRNGFAQTGAAAFSLISHRHRAGFHRLDLYCKGHLNTTAKGSLALATNSVFEFIIYLWIARHSPGHSRLREMQLALLHWNTSLPYQWSPLWDRLRNVKKNTNSCLAEKVLFLQAACMKREQSPNFRLASCSWS